MTAPQNKEHSPRNGELLRKTAEAVSIGTLALLAAEHLSTEVFYPRWRQGSLECFPHDAEPNKLPEKSWLIFGGLKYGDAGIIGEALQESLGEVAAVGYARYPNRRLGIETLAHFAKNSGVRNLNIYGHSMGTGVAMTFLSMLQPELQRGDIKVERFVMDGSPAEINDTNYEELLKALLSSPYPPGMLAKFGMHAWDLAVGKKLNSFIQEFAASPELVMNQLLHLEFSNPDRYQHILPYLSNTQFAYVYGENDTVVKTQQALKKWQRFLGGRVHEIGIPNGIHANPHEEPVLYNKALLNYFDLAA
ncbi:MAG: hypothetical protein ACREGJ_02890 [Candidatus Saccharimonadales bacterium]